MTELLTLEILATSLTNRSNNMTLLILALCTMAAWTISRPIVKALHLN